MHSILKKITPAIFILSVVNCSLSGLTPPVGATDVNWDERESLDLSKTIEPIIFPTQETTPVPRSVNEDAADDPAIWVHPSDETLSRIIGTDKRGGLAVYDLNGRQIQYLEVGSVNNVDLRYGFQLGDTAFDIAAASNRTTRTIDVFKINKKTGLLESLGSVPVSEDIDDVYGFALGYQSNCDSFFAFANGKNGVIEQYQLHADSKFQTVEGTLVKRMRVPTQPEGMVCDDLTGTLYVGEEEKGIWAFDAWNRTEGHGHFIEQTDASQNPAIVTDIEGISLFYSDEQEGYLIISSQGNHSYAVFERNSGHAYIGSFSIGDKNNVDGVEETDGLDVINIPLGEDYPVGLLVVQDGYNFDENHQPTSQNFKLISWAEVANALNLKSAPGYRTWMNRR